MITSRFVPGIPIKTMNQYCFDHHHEWLDVVDASTHERPLFNFHAIADKSWTVEFCFLGCSEIIVRRFLYQLSNETNQAPEMVCSER